METKRTKPRMKAILILIMIALSVILISCILINVTPIELEGMIFNFAEHHYFWFGFLSFIAGLFAYKFYLSIVNDAGNDEKNIPQIIRGSIKKSRRKSRYYLDRIAQSKKRSDVVFVEPRSIHQLDFGKDDVLMTAEEKEKRAVELKKSLSLGNQYKHKVRIFFKDKSSFKFTETTVWHADENFISLKGGISLPVRSIYKVVF